MTLPFDIKYRDKIESGEYKVETRNGIPMDFVMRDEATTLLVFRNTKDKDLMVYREDGKWYNFQDENCTDLFLVTPEEELTEWEKAVKEFSNACARRPKYVPSDGDIRTWAAELLPFAIKQVRSEFDAEIEKAYKRQDDVVYCKGYEDGKAEALKEMFNIVFPIDIFPFNTPKTMTEFADRLQEYAVSSYNHGFDEGKKVALKELPRWKKISYNPDIAQIAEQQLYYRGHKIPLADLKKLPGFKEK